MVDVADLGHHAVQVQRLDEHPRERAHEEVVQEDRHQLTRQLKFIRANPIRDRC